MPSRHILMLNTEGVGGMRSVVDLYQQQGLFEQFPIRLVISHCTGGMARRLGVFLLAYLRVMGLLISRRVALVHAHMASFGSFWRKTLFLLPACLLRVPSIVHLHGSEFQRFYEANWGGIVQPMVRFLFDRVTVVLVLSESWRQWVRGVTSNPNIIVLYNPAVLPPAMVEQQREAATILSLGRLGTRKGTYDLVAAVAKLKDAIPSVQLLLGGDGECRETVAFARKLGCEDRVQVPGWLAPEEKASSLSRATVYALPSYREGLPMSLLEAMAQGLPVVTTPIAGIPEAVTDGVEGLFVAPGDVDALASVLHRLLTHPALAERMGRAGRRKVASTFAAPVIIAQLSVLYRRLLRASDPSLGATLGLKDTA